MPANAEASDLGVLHEKLCNARVVRKDVRGPGSDLSEHLRMKVFDGLGHAAMFAYLRTLVNLSVKPNVEVTGAARLHRAASRERSERGRPPGWGAPRLEPF